jgi:cell division protein FtsQ
VLVHLGTSNFLERFKIYVAHVQEWRTQFQKLESVDLRWDHQVIVNPDSTSRTSKSVPEPQSAESTTNAPAPVASGKPAVKHKTKKHR